MSLQNESYKYQEIETYLRQRILRGEYQEGEAIESESQLSERFGLSRATVRHALSRLQNEGLILRGRGKRSLAAAGARAYRGKKYGRVALVTYDPAYFDMRALREAAIETLEKNGYEPVIRYVTESLVSERKALLSLFDQPLDGVIAEGVGTSMPSFNIDLFQRMEQMRLPIVFTNGYHANIRAAHVVANDREVMHGMVNHLFSLGHRNIGGIFSREQYQGLQRFQGYLDGLRANHLEYEDRRVMFLSFNDRRFIFDNLFNAYRDNLLECTAIVCYSDSYAEFLEATLLRNGISIPDGMSVTGMDNIPHTRVSPISLSTATLPLGEMGTRAAQTVIQMIETRLDAENVTMRCEFVKGNSTQEIRASQSMLNLNAQT